MSTTDERLRNDGGLRFMAIVVAVTAIVVAIGMVAVLLAFAG